MGMQTSDDEEQIMREHTAEQAYRQLYPWRTPASNATEDERAFYHAEIQDWMKRRPR